MDKKKAIVIAVVLFLLIGLGTFVFANPSESSLDGNDTGNVTDKGNDTQIDKDTDGKEENLDDNNNEDEEKDNVIPVVGENDNNVNTELQVPSNGNSGSSNSEENNETSTQVDNTAYLQALAALEKAELSFSKEDLSYANSLI